jgi:hypothetical protein
VVAATVFTGAVVVAGPLPVPTAFGTATVVPVLRAEPATVLLTTATPPATVVDAPAGPEETGTDATVDGIEVLTGADKRSGDDVRG